MKTYIALLKGINVGGHKKIPMADLRELLLEKGFKNVNTYIQSGNVIFDSIGSSPIQIETIIGKTINKAIFDHFGFDVAIIVRTPQELKRIFEACPFSEQKKKASYFMLLHKAPDDKMVKSASEKNYEGEEYKIKGDCIYYYNEKGFGRAKFNVNFFERKLKTFATARNYKTMVKLLELSS